MEINKKITDTKKFNGLESDKTQRRSKRGWADNVKLDNIKGMLEMKSGWCGGRRH